MNDLTGLGFDDRTTDGASCVLTSFDGEPGFHSVFAYVNLGSLDDYRAWIGEVEGTTVAGLPALVSEVANPRRAASRPGVLDVSV